MRDAQKLNVSFDEWMGRLLVHGICHLIGYDHETEREYAIMFAKEHDLCAALGITLL